MATISSYESLKRPSRSDLKQFSELLVPLFHNSSEEARREAAAVLSQCTYLPTAVALFIGSQPINVAAIFLTRSTAIDDATLMTIARSQGAAHARAIARRENLSPTVVDMLVGLRHADSLVAPADLRPVDRMSAERRRAAREAEPEADTIRQTAESVREELRALVTGIAKPEAQNINIPGITDIHEALLVRFAREHEGVAFARVLKETLQSSQWLAERVMLDLSGAQLGTTLLALGLRFEDISLILRSFYPALNEVENHHLRSVALLASLDLVECRKRVSAWLRADRYTTEPKSHEVVQPAYKPNDPRDPREFQVTYAAGPITALQVKSRKTLRAAG